MSKLKPCPFCGSTNIEIQVSTQDREGVPTNLMCSDCGATGPWGYEQDNSHAKADAAWNTRAVPDVPELLRYDPNNKTYPYFEMEESELGDYVRYDQAAEMITAKDKETK